MKKKVIIILVVILLIAVLATIGVYFGIIRNNQESADESEKHSKLDWEKQYLKYLKDCDEEDFQIGLLDLNTDEIPELILKTKNNFYKILGFDKDTQEIDIIVEDEISEIQLIYNGESKTYNYGYKLKDDEDTTNIFEEDIKNVTKLDNSTDEYLSNYLPVEENMQDDILGDVISDSTDEDKLKDVFDSVKENYKTTDEYVKDSGIDAETKLEETKKELSEKLSEEEALELGKDLYKYGSSLLEYDFTNQKTYMGKSRSVQNDKDNINVGRTFLGYKFENSSDVEDYFTQKRLNELTSDKSPEPYGLEKINGSWYYLVPGVGDDPTLLGHDLQIKSISAKEIAFTAITYYSDDFEKINENYMAGGATVEDYQKLQDNIISNIEQIKKQYKVTEVKNDFVIVKEDGKWKIDEQTILY